MKKVIVLPLSLDALIGVKFLFIYTTPPPEIELNRLIINVLEPLNKENFIFPKTVKTTRLHNGDYTIIETIAYEYSHKIKSIALDIAYGGRAKTIYTYAENTITKVQSYDNSNLLKRTTTLTHKNNKPDSENIGTVSLYSCNTNRFALVASFDVNKSGSSEEYMNTLTNLTKTIKFR